MLRRPFTIDDKLGVSMEQNGGDDGDPSVTGAVDLINSEYTTTRFSFSYSWWSAYGFKRRVKSDEAIAEGMKLIDQQTCYNQCGLRIKKDLMEGCAVVIFEVPACTGKAGPKWSLRQTAGSPDCWVFQML